MSDERIIFQRASPEQKQPKPPGDQPLGFGRYFSDYFFATEFDRKNGWHFCRIEPRRLLSINPAALCLHYGQQVFEGLKAYGGKNGEVFLFRWEKNAERLQKSCKRLMMECVSPELFGRAVKSLVLVDRDWIPKEPGCSLYIRPTLIATDPFLGVRPGDEYSFYIIVGPVGNYYPSGFNPIAIWVSDQDVRAVKGGLGEAKTAANYAHSLCAQQKATNLGYAQVLWLDAIEHKWVEEVGTMNIFFHFKSGEVVTPPLAGTILPGVTRDSVIQILKRWGIRITERPISIQEVTQSAAAGELIEAFGSGTAAVISPVGLLCYQEREIAINDRKVGELAQRLYTYLIRYQWGEEEDSFGWRERIDQLDLEQLTNPKPPASLAHARD
jgi:branched-chain amino acid aminotransferase